MQQLPLAIDLATAPRFEGFVPGANAAALEHLRALAAGAPPVYLWGQPGSGKTHLLGALGHAWQQRGARVAGFEAAQALPWTLADDAALITLDSCEALDPAEQHAAFTLFIEAATRGVPLVAAGRLPPVDLAVRDDLRTRLGWGHVFELQPLDEADARAALRREAEARGIFLSDEVMAYVLTRQARDMGSLMRLLDRLDRYALARARAVTVPLVRELLTETPATDDPP